MSCAFSTVLVLLLSFTIASGFCSVLWLCTCCTQPTWLCDMDLSVCSQTKCVLLYYPSFLAPTVWQNWIGPINPLLVTSAKNRTWQGGSALIRFNSSAGLVAFFIFGYDNRAATTAVSSSPPSHTKLPPHAADGRLLVMLFCLFFHSGCLFAQPGCCVGVYR